MRIAWPWTVVTPRHDANTTLSDAAALHKCPQCRHETGLLDEHWITLRTTRDHTPRATVCSPRCAVLWLEATYRPTGLGVAR